MDLVRQIKAIFDNYGYDTEVIVASVRNPLHVVDAALAGAHIATIPFSVIDQLVKHPLTDIGIEKFLTDWKKLEKKKGQVYLPRMNTDTRCRLRARVTF